MTIAIPSKINAEKETNQQYWHTHIQQWKESKLSQQTYCAQSGINLNSFTYWRGKFRVVSKNTEAKFVRVKVTTNHSASTTDAPRSIQIKLLTGHVVYIPTNLDITEMAKLINLLGMPHA